MDVDSGLLDELETSVHYDDNKSVNFPADRRSNNNSSPFRSEHLPSSPAQPPSHHSSFLDSNMQPPVKTNRSLQSLFSESSLSSSQHDASFYSANDKQSPADPRTTPNTRSSAAPTSSAHRSGLHPQSSPNTFTPMHINPLAQSTPFNQPAPRSTPISASSARREPYSPAVASSPRGILRSPATHNLSQTPTTPKPSTTASSATVPATTTAVHQSTTVTTVPLKNSPASPQVTFASLPAKAPLTTKKSLGKRVSDLSSAKSSMTHKSSDFSDEQQISNHRSESSRSSPQSAPNQSTPVAVSSAAAADETQKTVVKPSATSQQSGMTPARMLYNNLQSHSDDTRDDEEEDWIPLSKTTPAPRSRFLNTALYKDASEKVAGRDTQRAVVEEENEEEPQVLEKAVETKQAASASDARPAVPTTETKNGTDESERNPSVNTATTTKEVPRYLTSTTSSRLKSSPTKSVVTGLPPASPLRPQNGATLTGRGSPLRPPMSFSTRPQGSPVRNRSPLRNTVSRPASPQRKASDEDKQAKKPETVSKLPTSTAVSPLRQQPSIRLQMSPARSNLSRSASQLTINQASSIAVAAAAAVQVNGHSPMTSALRNMKSSTADVFRRARMLLFDNEANNKSGGKQQQQSSSGKELVHVSGAGSLSPAKKVQNSTKESSEQSSGKASKNMYPDISALLVDNAGSPGRPANNHGYAEGASSSNQGYMSASNPAKALFQAPNAFRSTAAASSITSTSQASTASDGTASTQRTSFDSGPESGDLKLSPAHSKPTGAAAGTVAAAAAAINSATAGSASSSSSLGLRDNKQQPTTKRVKSVVRKPATRAKQAPVVVRVPMGAQRELEQQRKFAQTATATVPASTSQEPAPAEVAHQQPSVSNEDESQPAKKTEQKREIDRRRQENARRAAMQQQQQQQQAEEKKRADEEEQARRKFALANRNSRVPQTRAVANLVVSTFCC
ncbi:hypothetical protein BZA70DRAFT_93535 [Myxozyma melibiosi]|uniref:TPX2 C-terminal domain-containing protein n=1 Tax=Myxozyma melibiosi TaxID=54550 RepID=A0ABR1EYV1_9ASCO